MISTWIVGPQLVGAVFLVAGWIQKAYPPKKINSWYGYRMPTAMASQPKWDEAQQYSGRLMTRLGLVYIAIGLALAAILYLFRALSLNAVGIVTIFAGISIPVLLIVYTEKHLDRMFKE